MLNLRCRRFARAKNCISRVFAKKKNRFAVQRFYLRKQHVFNVNYVWLTAYEILERTFENISAITL